MNTLELEQFSRQVGLPVGQWTGFTDLIHDAISGRAIRCEQHTGLSVLLLDYQTQIPFRLSGHVVEAPSIALWMIRDSPLKTQQVTFQLMIGSFEWQLMPGHRYSLQLIEISPQWINDNISTTVSLEHMDLITSQDALLCQLLRQEAEKLWAQDYQDPLCTLAIWKGVYTQLVYWFERLLQPTPASRYALVDHQQVEVAYQYLMSNLANSSITVKALAQMANMSLTKFNALFKERYARPVKELLTEKRLQVASELLATNQYTISQVALKVGFSNASGLTKQFKKKYGLLPKSFL